MPIAKFLPQTFGVSQLTRPRRSLSIRAPRPAPPASAGNLQAPAASRLLFQQRTGSGQGSPKHGRGGDRIHSGLRTWRIHRRCFRAFAALPTKIIVSEPARAHVSNAPAVPDLELARMNLANLRQLLPFWPPTWLG